MRKVLLTAFVAFAALAFAMTSVAQRGRRGRARGRGGSVASAPREPPMSPQIEVAMEGIQWGWTHDQVIEYFRLQINARYQPLLRNKGQVEQDQIMQRRDREVQELRNSYITFNGQTAQRRWDSSYIAEEYTHGNNESMLVREDREANARDFFFFFNDRLWKRYRSQTLQSGSGIDFNTFAMSIEGAFGDGLKFMREDMPDVVQTVIWQDSTTRMHLVDNSAFYNAFALVFEDRATLSRLEELRRNNPPRAAKVASVRANPDEAHVGNVDEDSNADIVDQVIRSQGGNSARGDAGAR
jgi:hypothetical protein